MSIRNQHGHPVEIVALLTQNRVELKLAGMAGKLIKHISELREDTPDEIKSALLQFDGASSLFAFDSSDQVELTEEGERAVRPPSAAPVGAEATDADDSK